MQYGSGSLREGERGESDASALGRVQFGAAQESRCGVLPPSG